jgi:predicted nucleic acid-binding Zn ribbon protein
MLRFPFQFTPPLGPGRKSSRQRILAQWRGVDTEPLERARSLRAVSAGAVLPRVLSDMRIDRRQGEAEIVKVWNQLLDPLIVAHAQPANLHKGTLFVTVDSSVWLNELVRYRRKEILDRLQYSFGRELIVRLSFRVG